MSKIQDAFSARGRRLFESEKPAVDAFNAKYARTIPDSQATPAKPQGSAYFEPFRADIKATHAGDPMTVSVFSSKNLLEEAVNLAMHEMTADAVLALVAQHVANMQTTLSKPRRRAGDIVTLSEGAGFGAEDGSYRIKAESGPNFSCPLCGNLECREWATLEQLDAQGTPTGECAYHVSECSMHDPCA